MNMLQHTEKLWWYNFELLAPVGTSIRNNCFRPAFYAVRLNLSLPRVVNFKLSLQPHQKYYITQYEELGCS